MFGYMVADACSKQPYGSRTSADRDWAKLASCETSNARYEQHNFYRKAQSVWRREQGMKPQNHNFFGCRFGTSLFKRAWLRFHKKRKELSTCGVRKESAQR